MRRLRRTPGFTTVAVLTLALGIGMSTAVYTVVDQSILRPFGYPDIDRMVLLNERFGDGSLMSVSWPNFLDWQAQNEVFEELGIYRRATATLTGSDLPIRLDAALVSASVFRTTGIAPLRGQAFTDADDRPDAAQVVVISERLWREAFAAAPEVVGRSILLNSVSHTVVGVMPAAMRFPARTTDVWLPLGPAIRTFPTARDNHPGLTAVGRLKPDVTIDAARVAMDVIAGRLATEYPDTNTGTTIVLRPYREAIVRDVRPAFQLLLAGVALMLLLACTNLATLMLTRANARRAELAVCAALGASRWRLLGQAMIEALMLATAGGLLGGILAYGAVGAFVASGPSSIPRLDLIRVDVSVLGVVTTLVVVAGLCFGVLPALRSSRVSARDAAAAGRGTVAGTRRLRGLLVSAQVAMALVLLIGAGLLGRSLAHLAAVDLGFDPSRKVTMSVALPPAAYPTLEAWRAFHQDLLARLSGAPGVESAAITSSLPLSGNTSESSLIREGAPMPTPEHPPASCVYTAVSANYLRTMGIELVAGRPFDARDGAGGEPVAIVDDSLVQKLFGGEDPIGRRIAFEYRGESLADPQPIWRTIVGVVHHVTHYGLTGEPPNVQVFVPYEQLPFWMLTNRPTMSLVVRTAAASEAMVATVRRTVQKVDADLPVFGVQTMEATLAQQTEQPRVSLLLFGSFAGLALVLAVLGLYGALAQTVAQRTREIGLRMALGARRSQVATLVARQAALVVGAGLVAGLVGAIGLARFLGAMLVGVSATDPLTLGGVAAGLALVAAVAATIPARRAASVDPLVALRE
ncbi:MAG: ABC transporter permease [Vicinamibacterales bacterium]